VNQAHFSPGGYQIVTAGCEAVYPPSSELDGVCQDGTAHVWGLDGYRLSPRLSLEAFDAQFSPDGTRLLVRGAAGAVLFEMESGVSTLALGGPGFMWAEFLPEGTHLLVVQDSRLEVRDAMTGELARPLALDGPLVSSAHVSPDGRWLHVGVEAGDQQIWTLNGEPDTPFNEAGIQWAVFSPRGNRLATVGQPDGHLRLWDTAGAGALIATLPAEADDAFEAVFSADGSRLLVLGSSNQGQASLWDAADGTRVATLPTGSLELSKIALNANGTRALLTESLTPIIHLLADDGADLGVGGGELISTQAEFSPDGWQVLAVVCTQPAGDGCRASEATLWDAATGTARGALGRPGQLALAAHFTPDGQSIVTYYADGSLAVWDSQGRLVSALRMDLPGTIDPALIPPPLLANAAGTRLAVQDAWGGLHLWRLFPTIEAMLAEADAQAGRGFSEAECEAYLGVGCE
jgi:WD40 repeat protein